MAFVATVAGVQMASAFAANAEPVPAAPRVSDNYIRVNGIKLHYLRAGTGAKTVILLHGWPQSSYEFYKVQADLARDYTVIVPDLRGVGGSEAPQAGYDKVTMAEDIHQLVLALGLKSVYLAGHDTGGMVAYAYARTHPEDLAAVAILDVPLPGIAPWDAIESNACCWHFRFHQAPEFAESMVSGRQAIYFRYNYDHNTAHPGAVTDKALKIYAKAYGSHDRLRAGFEFFRTFDQDSIFNKSQTGSVTVPVLLVGGDRTMGPALPVIADALRELGVAQVTTVVIANSGHWLAEEQPEVLITTLREFIGN